jgi:hypothetical protein
MTTHSGNPYDDEQTVEAFGPGPHYGHLDDPAPPEGDDWWPDDDDPDAIWYLLEADLCAPPGTVEREQAEAAYARLRNPATLAPSGSGGGDDVPF